MIQKLNPQLLYKMLCGHVSEPKATQTLGFLGCCSCCSAVLGWNPRLIPVDSSCRIPVAARRCAGALFDPADPVDMAVVLAMAEMGTSCLSP